VAAEEGRFQVRKVRNRAQRAVELTLLDSERWGRLSIEDGSTRIVTDPGQPTLPIGGQSIDHGRVIGAAAPVGQHLGRGRPAGLAGPQLGIPRDGNHPNRDRHLWALQPVRVALAVPTLVGVGERVAHRRRHAETGGQAGGRFAVG
jgi:hypothetical protein